jgi:hypothetical protein
MPPELERMLIDKASESGDSINRIIIAMLERGVGLRPGSKKLQHHDLDTLFGIWSAPEAKVFDRHMAEPPRVEPDLWN